MKPIWDDEPSGRFARRLVLTGVLMVGLAGAVQAQEPAKPEPVKPGELRLVVKDDRPKLWHWSDAVYWAGAGADTATSAGRQELNPLLANGNGRFSVSKGLALKAGVFAGLKLVAWRMPEHRRATRWMTVAIGVGWAAFAIHNMSIR